MLFIGITGGVGAGKTAILDYLREHYRARILVADRIAEELMQPGTVCYEKLTELFAAEDIFIEKDPSNGFDRNRLAAVIFADEVKRDALNAIVHPAVDVYVKEQLQAERERGTLNLLVIEAALLIEKHYDEICDELWYIFTSEENRKKRLTAGRGYSEEKTEQIFAAKLTEAEFRAVCKEEIDNNGTKEESFAQIDVLLSARGINPVNPS